MEPITIADLQLSYHEATRRNTGIIALVREMRESNTTLKIRDLNACFSSPLWISRGQATGHRKITHKVTRIIIEYQNHGDEVASHIQKQILEQAQIHLNILNDDIFKYVTRNWKTEPNYPRALQAALARTH